MTDQLEERYLNEGFPGVTWDPVRRALLEKVEGPPIKTDGWEESKDQFVVSTITLSKQQETELFYFLMDYPDVIVESNMEVVGYNAIHRITKVRYPFRHNMHESFTGELESTVLISGALFKDFRVVDEAHIEFPE